MDFEEGSLLKVRASKTALTSVTLRATLPSDIQLFDVLWENREAAGTRTGSSFLHAAPWRISSGQGKLWF